MQLVIPRYSFFKFVTCFITALLAVQIASAQTTTEAPDALVKRLSTDMLATIKADKALQAGDTARISAVVDSKVAPSVDFLRMTASSVGPSWRSATPTQRANLQTQFKALLIRTYAGALSQVKDQTVSVKPLRAAITPDDTELIVRTEIVGRGEPVALDYRVEKVGTGDPSVWKIYDVNVMGVWLVETYRGQFKTEINANGIDGLIATLTERNKALVAKK